MRGVRVSRIVAPSVKRTVFTDGWLYAWVEYPPSEWIEVVW